MVLLLIEHLCGHEPGVTDDLQNILEQLTKLSSMAHSRVALLARQVIFILFNLLYLIFVVRFFRTFNILKFLFNVSVIIINFCFEKVIVGIKSHILAHKS